MRNFIMAFLITFVALICWNHEGIAQSFQMLYAKSIQFEGAGVGFTVMPGLPVKAGAQVITIPDGTGTVVTSYSNFSYLMTALKALDAAHGSHSGINWTSFGY